MQAYAAQVKVGVVIGGGLLGLEAANALQNLGLETHVVEMAPRLMSLQIDDIGGAVLRRRIEALGVTVHLGDATTRIVTGPGGAVTALALEDGTELPTDMVVFSAGIRPRDELARAAGLELGERGGIVIDDRCRTSDPDDLRHRRVRRLQRPHLRPGRARLPHGARRRVGAGGTRRRQG